MVNMQAVRGRLEHVAAEFSRRLVWAETTDTVRLHDPARSHAEANVLAQFEAAMRTVLITSEGAAQTLIFLLSQDGSARTADNLLTVNFADRILQENFLARCVLVQIDTVVQQTMTAATVLWIDDPSFTDETAGLHYQGGVRKLAFEQYPWLADEARQRLADRKYVAKMTELSTLRSTRNVFHASNPDRPLSSAKARTVLFALYWLDFGGAEAFALRMIEAAKAQGYTVVVVCDEPGRHRVIERAAGVADAVYLLGSYSVGISKEAAMLRIIERHAPDVVHIHHSWVSYRMLPALRALGLAPKVIDSTHILEYRFGDFVSESIRYSAYIDCHHVISLDLSRVFVDRAGVPADQVRLGKLYDMSQDFAPVPGKWDRTEPFYVAFVGRFTQQKRPYLFVQIAQQLVRKFGQHRFVFEAVGEGAMLAATQSLAERLGVGDRISFLPGNTPVSQVLGRAHVLVVCSENEGLTLVGFEAVRAGAIVVSTDVGAQREIVASPMLVPRHPLACVRQMVDTIGRLANGRISSRTILNEQSALLAVNLELPTGTAVCLDFYAQSDLVEEADVSPS